MVWFKPWTWFSRNAQVVLANANTNVLKSALRNYIKAVNNLPNKNNAYIYGLMTKTANGANASYKNRLANGIAKVVAASRRALPQAAEAVVTGAPEGPAAEAVNNATAAVNNLNALMAKPINSLTTSELIRLSNKTNISNNTRRSLATAINTKLAALAPNNSNTREALEISRNKLIPKPPALNETNRLKKINAALSEINAAGNNVNKLRGIKTRLNNAKFNRDQASTNAVAKYNSLTNKITANQALKNANALTPQSNQATINSVLNKLRKVQNRVPNTMRSRVANKIANVERQSLLKMPKQGN